MSIGIDPHSPCVRVARFLLHRAVATDIRQIRLSMEGDVMSITFDGQPQEAPKADRFLAIAEAFLNLAGCHLWPWSRAVARKRLEFESPPAGLSSWVLETKDIRSELLLKRL